jgi:Tol biopolymer transport system component
LLYAFRRHRNDHDQWYLAEVPVAGGPERLFGDPSDTPIYGAKWLPDKSGLIVNAVDEATRQPQIYAVSYPDGAKRRITNDLNSYVGFGLTADAQTMVLPQTNSNRQIWSISDGHGGAPTQLTFGNETHYESVSWIGDDYIVFDQDENSSYDNYNIWRMKPDGTERVQLTFGSDNNTQPTVSQDGRSIVFVSRHSGKRQVWLMNTDGTNLKQLTDFPGGVFNPRPSSDGRWVYFGTSEAGMGRIRRISADGGESELVIDTPTQVWDISPDGSRIAFSTLDRSSGTDHVWIWPIGGGTTPEKALAFEPETWMKWSPEGKSIFYNTGIDSSQNVWMARFDGSKRRQVTDFKNEGVFVCAWSTDGSRSACIRQAISFDVVLLRFN